MFIHGFLRNLDLFSPTHYTFNNSQQVGTTKVLTNNCKHIHIYVKNKSQSIEKTYHNVSQNIIFKNIK